jgi:hypothetical protein
MQCWHLGDMVARIERRLASEHGFDARPVDGAGADRIGAHSEGPELHRQGFHQTIDTLSLPETTSDSIGGAGHRGWAPE